MHKSLTSSSCAISRIYKLKRAQRNVSYMCAMHIFLHTHFYLFLCAENIANEWTYVTKKLKLNKINGNKTTDESKLLFLFSGAAAAHAPSASQQDTHTHVHWRLRFDEPKARTINMCIKRINIFIWIRAPGQFLYKYTKRDARDVFP